MLEEELQLEIAVLAALHLEVLLEGLQDKIILEEAEVAVEEMGNSYLTLMDRVMDTLKMVDLEAVEEHIMEKAELELAVKGLKVEIQIVVVVLQAAVVAQEELVHLQQIQ